VTLSQLLAERRHVLLDFDGPVCSVFGGIPAHHVNRHYAAILRDQGIGVSADLADGDDPLAIFQTAATARPERAPFIEHTLRDLEVHAITSAPLSPGASESLLALRDTGHSVTIVSNNSAAAVRVFIDQHGLGDLVGSVVARSEPNPALLKPNPHLVRLAITNLRATAADCVLIGDSATDITAGHTAGVAVVAYANRSDKRATFASHQPEAIIDTMHAIPLALASRADGRAVNTFHT
jgi:beta-phosphoglucomutase-like phosphatase (HAD superfamily)